VSSGFKHAAVKYRSRTLRDNASHLPYLSVLVAVFAIAGSSFNAEALAVALAIQIVEVVGGRVEDRGRHEEGGGSR